MSANPYTEMIRGGGETIPLFIRNFTISLDAAGMSTLDVFGGGYDSKAASDSIVAFQSLTGQDAVVGCVHSPAFLVEHFGGRMKYPSNGIPVVEAHPAVSPRFLDLEDHPLKGGALSAVESHRLVKGGLPDTAVVANITGPLTKASVLMGMDVLSIALIEDPSFVRDVIAKSMIPSCEYMDRIISEGSSEDVFIASASDNNDLFGDDALREFTFPFLKGIVSEIHSAGATATFHPHGDWASKTLIDDAVATGIDCFQYAEGCDPENVCDLIDGRCAVMGGTDIVPTLHSGTPGEISDSVRMHMEACSGSRFVFSCSCSLQTGIPLDGIVCMVDEYRRIAGR